MFDDCLKKLNALGCKYCVIDSDGGTHGELKVESPKLRRYKQRWLGIPLEKEVADMQIGDVRVVSMRPEGTLDDLRSALSFRARKLYGTGSCTAMVNNKTNSVEIMRVT